MLADMVIDEDLFRGNEQNRSWLKMSRVHFEVNRQHGRMALLDKSSNGTYINKVRVGKEKSSRLAHLDEIGVLECDFALYYFLDEGLLKCSSCSWLKTCGASIFSAGCLDRVPQPL